MSNYFTSEFILIFLLDYIRDIKNRIYILYLEIWSAKNVKSEVKQENSWQFPEGMRSSFMKCIYPKVRKCKVFLWLWSRKKMLWWGIITWLYHTFPFLPFQIFLQPQRGKNVYAKAKKKNIFAEMMTWENCLITS